MHTRKQSNKLVGNYAQCGIKAATERKQERIVPRFHSNDAACVGARPVVAIRPLCNALIKLRSIIVLPFWYWCKR